jgi:hypothetical protein
MKREPLEVERLIRDDQHHTTPERRRVSVAEHQRFRADLAASLADLQPDPIDDALEADPMIERIARRRKNSEAARTLAILDELKEGAKYGKRLYSIESVEAYLAACEARETLTGRANA